MGKDEDQKHDDSVDSRDAAPIEETTDSSKDAPPVDNVGEVIGKRNTSLPLENPKPRNNS